MAFTVIRSDRHGGSIETVTFAKSFKDARTHALELSIKDPRAYYAAANSDDIWKTRTVELCFFHDGHELDSKEEAALRRNTARVR